MRAGAVHDTEVIKEGNGCPQNLLAMTTRGGDFVDVCAHVPGDAITKIDSPGTSVYRTKSLLHFSELVQNVPLYGIVRVSFDYSRKKTGKSS